MDCDSCGRYRPSSEIIPMAARDSHVIMACARCRRIAAAAAGQSAAAAAHSAAVEVRRLQQRVAAVR